MMMAETSARSRSCERLWHVLEDETCSPAMGESCEGRHCSEILCEHEDALSLRMEICRLHLLYQIKYV